LLHLLTSAVVKVLGRLHDYPMDERRWQASEKRQGTKSREWDRRPCGGLWGISLEAHGSDSRFWGKELAGLTGGMVLEAVRKVGKRAEGLLDVCLRGRVEGRQGERDRGWTVSDVREGWLCGESSK